MSRLQLLVAGAACAALPLLSTASSHREAPNITRLPTVDSTDFYIFNSYEAGRGDYVTLLANYIPLQDAVRRPELLRAGSRRRSTRSTSTTTATPART